MDAHFISQDDLTLFILRILEDSRVFAPVGANLQNITQENAAEVTLRGFRTVEPLKALFFSIIENVSVDVNGQLPKLVVFGARGCDLEALEVQDKVFIASDFPDPFYVKRRENTVLIGADCTACGKTCFCDMARGVPYPTKLFDLNFSSVSGGYVVEARTEKGERLVTANQNYFIPAKAGQLSEKNQNREKIVKALNVQNKDYDCNCSIDWTEAHKKNLTNGVWRTLTKDCVECSACNFACPSCTCFLLLDQPGEVGNEKQKEWDACLKAGYARTAGGGNSRPKLFERLQNRYHCKFDYSFDRLGRYTCVGCGRCIDGCAANIDMRQVFAELIRQVPLTAELE